MSTMPIIARLHALATENTEALEVLVAERDLMNGGGTEFIVFINGGLLADGEDEFVTKDLGEALTRAANEIKGALTNEC